MPTDSYTSAGSHTWTCPAGVTEVTVECWGGGGRGGGGDSNDGGGGGGGGAYSSSVISVTPGNDYTVTVGAGGTGTSGAVGDPGGDSWFDTTGTVLAKGGAGGRGSPIGGAGGAGGAAASGVGGTKYSGGSGDSSGGGGGSSAGTGANGNNASGSSGAVAPSGGGGGGNGGDPGTAGSAPGGGGGGGQTSFGDDTTPGNGAAGQVILTYEAAAADPPTLTSIDPTSGSTEGGTAVTLTGTDFAEGATVTFGGQAATDVVVVSDTSITCVTPAHTAGAVDVVVTNADEQSDTLEGAYTYVEPAASILPPARVSISCGIRIG